VDEHIDRWIPALLKNLAPPNMAISGGEPGTMYQATVEHLMQVIHDNLDRPTKLTVYTNGLFIKKYHKLMQRYNGSNIILNYRWHVSAEFGPEPMAIAPSLREYLDTIPEDIRRETIHPLVVVHKLNLPDLEAFLAANPEHDFFIDTLVPSRKMFDEGTVEEMQLLPEDYTTILGILQRSPNVVPYVVERTAFYVDTLKKGTLAPARAVCGQSIKVLSIDLLAERIYRCCDFRDELVDDSIPLSDENIKMRLIQGLFKPNPRACSKCHDIIFHYRGEMERRAEAQRSENRQGPSTPVSGLRMFTGAPP
jgi:hypothetical protein